MGDDVKKSFRDLTPSEKAQITKAINKFEKESDEAVEESRNAFFTFLEKEIYPTRNSAIDLAQKVRDEKIAEANAQYEKDYWQAVNWQENHPEVIRLQKVYDGIWTKEREIVLAKTKKVYASFGLGGEEQ